MEEATVKPEEDFDEDTHPAILTLKQLLQEGKIQKDSYSDLVFKFKKLHQAFSQSCSTEQVLLRRTRDLSKERKAQELTIQNSANEQLDHRTQLTALRQYVTNLQAELEATREQFETTKANTEMKKKEREKLSDKVAKARDDQRLKLEPQKRQMQLDIKNLEETINQRRQTINTLKDTASQIADRIQQCEDQLADIEKQKRAANQKMLEIGSIPIKMRQKSAAVEASHNTMLSEEKACNNQLSQADQTLVELQTRSHDLETEYQHVTNDIEGISSATSELKSHGEDLRQRCADQMTVKQQREYESRRIIKLVGEQNKSISQLETKGETINKDINKKQKENQRIKEAMSRLSADTEALGGQLITLQKDLQKEEATNRQMQEEYEKANKAKEAAIRAILAMEEINNETLEQIKKAMSERDSKQATHDQFSKKEKELESEMAEASLIRDRKAREMAAMKKKVKDLKTIAMERNLDYLDQCRKVEQISQQLSEFSILYENVKLERNKNINRIQTSRQMIVELKEKIRILENEVEVLRSEFVQISASVKLQKNKLIEAYKRRDQTKGDLKRKQLEYRDLQSKIDFQANEQDRLNGVLGGIEHQIKVTNKRYQIQTDDANNIQRLIIDKQDQFCLVQEQYNRHEVALQMGETELRKREEELRLLNLQLQDFARQIDVMSRKSAQVKAYDAEIEDLAKQLKVERADVDKITMELEAPNLNARKRKLRGKDFTAKELADKVALYEQRISTKKTKLWEKKILLKEIEDKIGKLKGEKSSDSQRSQKMSEKGALKSETMSLKRKKMAALAEMGLYQAQSLELEEDKAATKAMIEEAQERAQRGEAFDETAEKIMRMHERDKESRSGTANAFDEEEEVRPGRQRFDAYPTEDGLSRPYGAFPVFQPAPVPGYARHYKKEVERPIEL